MLSTITIISIFVEIFISGILVAGAYTFFKKYFLEKKTRDLFSALVFLCFFLYVAAGVASQLMFNLGRDFAELILIHKGISISLVFCAAFLWLFMVERFQIRGLKWSCLLWLLIVIFFIYRIMDSQVNLVYREGIIEPVVYFSMAAPVKPLFSLVGALLAVFSFGYAARQRGGQKNLAQYLGFSALFLLIAFLLGFSYVRFGESLYLLGSWIFILIFVLFFILAGLVAPDAPEAKHPFQYLRTRLLFKLLLIFVLLIVILFETTTLATIYISKKALSSAIMHNYLSAAQELVLEINSLPRKPSFSELEKIASKSRWTVDQKGMFFVVDNEGKLIAHPDKKRALQHEDVSLNKAVKKLLEGERGAGEFRDEMGSLMAGAYLPIDKYGWGVVVEEPLNRAYFELRRLETNSLLFVIAGIVMTALVGVFFARSIEKPIKGLTAGTEAVARGDLSWRISVDSADEIGKLAQAFNQMTEELKESQERLVLSEKLASLGTMAAGMAHEIKNPLVSVRTFTQLLQQKWEDPQFREKFSAIVPQEIERINRIAESLLKFGKPMKPELTKADINSLLDEVLLLFESECKKYNVRVTKKFAELPEISGDPGQLQQAFVNIIKNAIESMQSKGGELVVKTDVGEVVRLGELRRQGVKKGEEMVWGEEEQLPKPAPVVFIEVSDTGEGIPEENLKSLFDPFFTTKMTGTGMGLPITLRIIEEHKGSFKVRSQLGKGTTFIITLPQK